MRDHPRPDDHGDRVREADRAAGREAAWARMSGRERIQHLLDLQGPRPTDKPVPTGWDAPGVKDHPQRPDPAKIRLPDDRRTHILDGDPNGNGGGHRHGTGRPGKTEFPERWDDATAARYMRDVAEHPDAAKFQDNGRWKVTGTRDNVALSVIVEPDGRVWTSYPKAGGDGVIKNPKKQVGSDG